MNGKKDHGYIYHKAPVLCSSADDDDDERIFFFGTWLASAWLILQLAIITSHNQNHSGQLVVPSPKPAFCSVIPSKFFIMALHATLLPANECFNRKNQESYAEQEKI